MKKINQLAQNLLAGAIALALVAVATTASAENVPQIITVLKVEGQARYTTDNKTWHALKRGDVLKPGTVIQTADDGAVNILMGERASTLQAAPVSLGSSAASGAGAGGGGVGDNAPKANIVRIFPSSVLAIDKLVLEKTGVDEVAETQLDLRAGQIMGNVKKLSAASRYEVKIPNGVAGIRGTTYMVSATGVVYVLSGSVIISYVNGQGQLVTATVTAGQSFNPFNGPNGTTAPIPPATLAQLTTAYTAMGGPPATPNGEYTKNGTDVHISSN